MMKFGKFFSLDSDNPFMRVFVPLGFLQGLILYCVSQDLMAHGGSLDAIEIFWRGYGVLGVGLITAGLAFFLSYGKETWFRAVVASGLFGLLHAALWLVAVPFSEKSQAFEEISIWYASAAVLTYVAMPFLQIYVATGRRQFAYEELYRHGWNNGQIVASSYMLTGLFFAVFGLAGALFDILKIKFFLEMLKQAWFLIPAYFTVKAVGYAIARDNEGIVHSLRRLCLGFCRFLAPVLAVFAMIFVAMLPFAGLELVWKTRMATPIFLGFSMLMILFFNSIFQDGAEEKYFTGIGGKLQRAALVILPVFGFLACYSTWLRIGQYGLTPDRFYAELLGAIVCAYGVTYAYAAFRPVRATAAIRRGNVIVAQGLIVVAIITLMPLTNAVSLSAGHQYRLIAENRVDPEKFDFWFLKHRLGEPGKKAFEKLKAIKNHPQQEKLAAAIEKADKEPEYRPYDSVPEAQLRDGVRGIPVWDAQQGSEGKLPEEVIDLMASEYRYQLQTCAKPYNNCAMVAIDLDRDGVKEWVWLQGWNNLIYKQGADGKWQRPKYHGTMVMKKPWQEFIKAVTEGKKTITAKPPQFDELVLGDDISIGFAPE
ncbi:MAG: hypothetical protein WDO70_05560 [Alphaproteobacteria bacterium]